MTYLKKKKKDFVKKEKKKVVNEALCKITHHSDAVDDCVRWCSFFPQTMQMVECEKGKEGGNELLINTCPNVARNQHFLNV